MIPENKKQQEIIEIDLLILLKKLITNQKKVYKAVIIGIITGTIILIQE